MAREVVCIEDFILADEMIRSGIVPPKKGDIFHVSFEFTDSEGHWLRFIEYPPRIDRYGYNMHDSFTAKKFADITSLQIEIERVREALNYDGN